MEEAVRKIKILVVEDEPDSREIYMDILRTGGYEVAGATDGDNALAILTYEKFDLILLDVMMPKKDGIQTLAEMKESPDVYGTPKVVVLTNIGGDVAIDKVMELGADGYMLKSEIDPAELVITVGKYIQ